MVELPNSFEHKIDNYSEENFTDLNSLDTLIIGKFPVQFYAVLADTNQFYTFIFYAPAATFIPVVATYDKSGNPISSESIDFGCWDGGPYDYTCEGKLAIDKDLSLSLNHTTHVTKSYVNDSVTFEPTDYSYKWKGKILSNGKIDIEKRPE